MKKTAKALRGSGWPVFNHFHGGRNLRALERCRPLGVTGDQVRTGDLRLDFIDRRDIATLEITFDNHTEPLLYRPECYLVDADQNPIDVNGQPVVDNSELVFDDDNAGKICWLLFSETGQLRQKPTLHFETLGYLYPGDRLVGTVYLTKTLAGNTLAATLDYLWPEPGVWAEPGVYHDQLVAYLRDSANSKTITFQPPYLPTDRDAGLPGEILTETDDQVPHRVTIAFEFSSQLPLYRSGAHTYYVIGGIDFGNILLRLLQTVDDAAFGNSNLSLLSGLGGD